MSVEQSGRVHGERVGREVGRQRLLWSETLVPWETRAGESPPFGAAGPVGQELPLGVRSQWPRLAVRVRASGEALSHWPAG